MHVTDKNSAGTEKSVILVELSL